jgi:transcriptional regulator with XRE-family HTH domain
MLIGDRIRALRERKQLSQVELAVRAGVVRSYISGIENGYIVPSVETMEKIAQVLEIPLHKLFYDGDEPPLLTNLPNRLTSAEIAWERSGGSNRSIEEFRQQLNTFGKTGKLESRASVHPVRLSEPLHSKTHCSSGLRDSHRNLVCTDSRTSNKT